MLASLVLSALVSAAPPAASVRYLAGSVGRLRAAPEKTAAVKASLPIGVELQVRGRQAGFVEVETLDGETGWISASLLSPRAPALDDYKAKAAAAKPGSRARLRALERATALAPSDLEVIEDLADTLARRRAGDRVYYARKGWVAAKRRSLAWDGPLYPIVDGVARFPAPCAAHEDKPAGPNGKDKARDLDEETRALRARAFAWVSSGKVVSVTERGYTTQKLSRLACAGAQLAYKMPVPVREGALVPSWMVAGFEVTPLAGGVARSARRRVEIELEGEALTVRASTFTTTRAGTLKLRRAAKPVAVFSEGASAFTLLLLADGGRACSPGEKTASLVRARVDGDALVLEQGRPWSSGFAEGCAQTTFTQLDGEPRDISRENLLSEEWKR